ncbi:Uncharacterised protein [Streptococcus pneumoniae]|nr:Uncharacterised protein [Streptococcus pneumoniae]
MFQLFSISKSWGKNVHWTFQLFPISGVGLIQFLRLTSSILFQGAGLKHPPNLLTVFIFSVRLKTSPGLTSSLLFKGTGLKTSTGCSNSSPFLGVGLIQSPRLYHSSIKLLKTSSIMFHSSSESSGIGCNSPSVPSSFSMNE